MNILLICGAGASTSILVEKMKEAAEKHDIPANIWAVGAAARFDNMPKADIIMLGPQVRFMQAKIQAETDKKVVVIDMNDYGLMRGDNVLKTAIKELMADKKK